MGIFGGEYVGAPMAWPLVAVICTISNIMIGWGMFFLMSPVMKLMRKLPFLDRLAEKYLDRSRNKLQPMVEKYGFLGLSLFIGIPLPMTGAYTGAMGAYALGMKTRSFMLANIVGVFIACICVTAICLLIKAGISCPLFDFMIKS